MGEDIRPLSKKDLTKFLETMRFSIMSSFLLLMSGPTYFAGGEDDGQRDIHLHFQMNEQSGGDTAVANEQQKDEDGGEDKPEKEEQGNDYSGDDNKGNDNSDSKGAGGDYNSYTYGSYNPQYREYRENRRPPPIYPPPIYPPPTYYRRRQYGNACNAGTDWYLRFKCGKKTESRNKNPKRRIIVLSLILKNGKRKTENG